MLKMKPVHHVSELKKDDLIHIIGPNGGSVVRVDCIDGKDLFVTSPEDNLSFRRDGVDHMKTSTRAWEVYSD